MIELLDKTLPDLKSPASVEATFRHLTRLNAEFADLIATCNNISGND